MLRYCNIDDFGCFTPLRGYYMAKCKAELNNVLCLNFHK